VKGKQTTKRSPRKKEKGKVSEKLFFLLTTFLFNYILKFIFKLSGV
jgi:hypothetical protein